MASAKLQKPSNESSSRSQEEQRFSYKMSEITAWGGKMFGQKHEHQTVSKHCSTCQCPPNKDVKSVCTEKGHATTASVKDTKYDASTGAEKKEKRGEYASAVNKDVKQNAGMESKEKHHTTSTATKDSKLAPSNDVKTKEKKEKHAKINMPTWSNMMNKKEHNGEPANHCFSSMADHWKERLMMMKKPKDGKSKYDSSSSSSSDSEDEVCDNKKKEKKQHQEIKNTSHQKAQVQKQQGNHQSKAKQEKH